MKKVMLEIRDQAARRDMIIAFIEAGYSVRLEKDTVDGRAVTWLVVMVPDLNIKDE